ncbi:HutD/Ves family protein [Listeria kieliensis]|uniref:HutD/Ves family protein n=1 Tax=Listeria kieliensis TaxID=1621700 RepID=UPI000E21617E|nr:HutD family protein [Listeria kieliensis]
MEMVIKRKSEYKKSIWPGGTTTELLIWPEKALYEERNFKYRISTATVNLPTSTFTSLSSYWRELMILDGEIELLHENATQKREVKLSVFEQDSFSGAETTTSYGQCTDFNLIYTPTYTGSLSLIKPEEKYEVEKGADYFYYSLVEEMQIRFSDGQVAVLGKGDSLFLQAVNQMTMQPVANTYSSSDIIAIEAKISNIKR